jgi:hypothetical protein
MANFVLVALLSVMAGTAAKEELSLRGAADRDLHDWQLGDFASARPQSVPGNYYTTTGGGTASAIALYDSYPLGQCQGGCANDSQCANGLMCFKRSGTQAVPGCTGTGRSGLNYCYSPTSAGNSTGSNVGFRLRLFWQKGDFWHHQYGELFLCMVCHTVALGGSGCQKDDDTHFQTCSANSTHFVFNAGSGGSVQIQVAGSDLCLELSSRVAYQAITLQICDSGNADQYFTSGRGSFTSSTFELSANGGGCLSSTHLPKEGEYIYNQDCGQPRAVNANLWQKW